MKLLAFVIASLVAFPAWALYPFHTGGAAEVYPASGTATITANLSSTSNTIPADFVGFANEMQDVIEDQIYTGSNTSLQGLVKLLGPCGMVRYGGNTQDLTPIAPALNSGIASDVFNFINSLGSCWHVSWGLDGQINSSSTAVAQAGLIRTAFGGDSKVAFAVENEPEAKTGGTTAFGTLWSSYYTALVGAYPSINMVGPSTFNAYTMIAYANATTFTPSQWQHLTFHFYNSQTNPPYTASTLLATMPNTALSNNTWYVGANSLRVEEWGPIVDNCASNIPCGGIGLTNKLVAATFYIEMASQAASLGYAGINLHNSFTLPNQSPGAPQNAWGSNAFYYNSDATWSATPIFYGLFIFSKIEGLPIISTTNTALDSAATVIAVKQASGKAAMIIANGNTTTNISVKPDQSTTWSTANEYLLTGSSCYDPNPVLNGYPIGKGGAWSGTVQSINYGTAITIPPCGAALVQIQ